MFENLTITAILLVSGAYLFLRIKRVSTRKPASGAGCGSGCGGCGTPPTSSREVPLRMHSS
ncbi:MAG: hypothetical protein IV090_11990 [Candidatus Sericytochromatia bacterium]|nr:hypothetical protein [Candidatus Sericytochromatia bacterium]